MIDEAKNYLFMKSTTSMRYFLIIILFLFTKIDLGAQIVDSSPSGDRNVLQILGGGIVMKIDSLTPLHELIGRLDQEWRLVETGKMYWIGYTPDMFSIAAYGSEAISALVKFYGSAKKKGKIGAIYTLHLIGIDSRITGRNTEKFINIKARLALLDLLRDEEYAHYIVHLLMRDPWRSDVPYFMEVLKTENENIAWPIIGALFRYNIPELPIQNEIPDSIRALTIELNEKNKSTDFHSLVRSFDSRVKKALKVFHITYPAVIDVEKDLYNETVANPKVGYYEEEVNGIVSVDKLLDRIIDCSGGFGVQYIGGKIQYYVEDEKIYFCTIKTAQKRLNEWWHKIEVVNSWMPIIKFWQSSVLQ